MGRQRWRRSSGSEWTEGTPPTGGNEPAIMPFCGTFGRPAAPSGATGPNAPAAAPVPPAAVVPLGGMLRLDDVVSPGVGVPPGAVVPPGGMLPVGDGIALGGADPPGVAVQSMRVRSSRGSGALGRAGPPAWGELEGVLPPGEAASPGSDGALGESDTPGQESGPG